MGAFAPPEQDIEQDGRDALVQSARERATTPEKPTALTKPKSTPEPSEDYGADEITVLEGLDPVRVRPGMYIGSTTSRGLHHLIWEIVDNAVDEALAGHCTEITVTLGEDNTLEVTDNGRGIPVATHTKSGESALDLVFTKLHAGGKFGGGGYKVSGGLHGVGASVTNALSEWLRVEVRRDGHAWTAAYARGKSTQAVTQGRKLKKGEGTGTTVSWLFDSTIFDSDVRYSASTIEQRLREKSYLVRGLRFVLQIPGKPQQVFVSKNGIADLIAEMNAEREAIHPGILNFSSEIDPVEREAIDEAAAAIPVEIALQWTKSADERIFSFANVVPTGDGSTHVSGLRRAVTRAVSAFAYSEGKLKKDKKEAFDGRDIFEGLTAAVTVKIENPQFEGQTKGRLNNPEGQTAVATYAYAVLSAWLSDKANAKQAKAILERCLLAREIRLAKGKISKKLRDNATSIFSDSNLPGKLADCLETRPVEERELFIVEGDSAMGSAKAARDAAYQAIMPIRGKVLNVLGAKNGRAFDNVEIEGILTALGGRKDVIGRAVVATLEPQMRRYGKVVILADADVDGAHITNLLLTMFSELFPQMIAEGRIFIANPPLYRINLDSRGEKFVYALTDQERADLVKKHKRSGDDVSRFKGLGEMNASDLARTTLDPETRSLLQVTVEDPTEAADTLNLIMGSRPEPRRLWLEDIGLNDEVA
ncbi:DNA gyrase/topoisomerase IV subunit B [Miltoncostaea oceani]|uniref:DNA gyrase/topoisomerase IV subunit B n=1 Tax=Miltoncostaea oceani TaxID=2843216 RepID=UPI001C3CC1D6|nr:DNA topoisomerase IV subunit B [Miltoncostaea oceani]